MRGTDPTKSKWECPNMLYVCFWLRPLYRDKRKLTECITEQIIRNSGYFFVCNIRQHYAIFYHIYVQMYKLDSNMSKYWRFCIQMLIIVQTYRVLMRKPIYRRQDFNYCGNNCS